MIKKNLVEKLINVLKTLPSDSMIGVRTETDGLPDQIRSKAIRAFLVDAFGGYENEPALHELEREIRRIIGLSVLAPYF